MLHIIGGNVLCRAVGVHAGMWMCACIFKHESLIAKFAKGEGTQKGSQNGMNSFTL